jgi:hypothetical protein
MRIFQSALKYIMGRGVRASQAGKIRGHSGPVGGRKRRKPSAPGNPFDSFTCFRNHPLIEGLYPGPDFIPHLLRASLKAL